MAQAAQKIATAETTTPVETAKPAFGTPQVTKVGQTLREAQPKKAAPSTLQVLGQEFEVLGHKPASDVTLEDILKPVYWANVSKFVEGKIGSLIYVRPQNGAFKVLLTIEGITLDNLGQVNGLKVEPWLLDKKAV